MTAFEQIVQEAALPNEAAKQFAADGGKVIGTICCHVPEELIHAAGALPVRLRATGSEDDSVGKAYMSTFSCSFAHTTLQRLIDGTYDYLSGVVSSDGCIMAQRIFDNWRYAGTADERLAKLVFVPRVNDPGADGWLRAEYDSLREEVGAFTGVEVTDERLRASVELYNETRRLIRELYGLQKGGQLYIKGSDVARVILGVMSMPKERANVLLAQLIEELRAAGPIASDKPRVVLAGSALDDPSYIEAIEAAGVDVVMDMQCFGSRYLWEPVATEGDLMDNLVQLHLTRPTCPRMMDSHVKLYDFLANAVKEYDAQGVIQVTMRYCDVWNGERFIFGERYKAQGIPALMLEREEITGNAGQLAVRVEAFAEMLEDEE